MGFGWHVPKLPGLGDVQWGPFFAALHDARYDGPVCIEVEDRAYEKTFGFRFIVFVNGRSRAELVPVLRERLQRTREEELDTALHELVAIARDRWSSR